MAKQSDTQSVILNAIYDIQKDNARRGELLAKLIQKQDQSEKTIKSLKDSIHAVGEHVKELNGTDKKLARFGLIAGDEKETRQAIGIIKFFNVKKITIIFLSIAAGAVGVFVKVFGSVIDKMIH